MESVANQSNKKQIFNALVFFLSFNYKINLKHGVRGPETRTGTETDTCTACAGTMILEFAALSRFTGDPVFEVETPIHKRDNQPVYINLQFLGLYLTDNFCAKLV